MSANPYYESLIESIRTTTSLIQSLNKELKDNEINLATLKARLDGIDEGVRGLTKLVRDGNGANSIMTRLALIEGDIKELSDRDTDFRKFVYAKVEELREEIRVDLRKTNVNKRMAYNREKVITILKILPGVIALIITLIGIFY